MKFNIYKKLLNRVIQTKVTNRINGSHSCILYPIAIYIPGLYQPHEHSKTHKFGLSLSLHVWPYQEFLATSETNTHNNKILLSATVI